MTSNPVHRIGSSRSSDALLIGAFLIAFVSALLLRVIFGYQSLNPMLWALAVMLVALVRYEWKLNGHPLTPMGVLSIAGVVLFVMRPLAIQSDRFTSAGALADSRSFTGATADAGVDATVEVVLFYAALSIAYFVLTTRRSRPAVVAPAELTPDDRALARAGVIVWFTCLLAIVCIVLLVQGSGGLSAHFAGLASRSSFISGRYFLTLGYIPLSVALANYVLLRRRVPSIRRTWNSTATISALMLIASAFMTGARAPLLLGAIIPLLILKQTGPKPVSNRGLVFAGLVMVVGALLVSLVFRANVYDSGASVRQLEADPVGTLLSRVTSGSETASFDSLILLNEVNNAGEMQYQLGWTYATVPLWFVPGNLVPFDKGGANTWFTSNYLPRFYYPNKTETSISAIGEAFANFGDFGVVILGLLLAVAASKIGLKRARGTTRQNLFAITLTPLFFSFLRGDSYQNLSTVLLIALLVWAVHALTKSTSEIDSAPELVPLSGLALRR